MTMSHAIGRRSRRRVLRRHRRVGLGPVFRGPRQIASHYSSVNLVGAREVKYLDGQLNGATALCSSNPPFGVINQVGGGTEAYNRVGRNLDLISVQLKTNIFLVANSAGTPIVNWRICLFYDRQSNVSTPGWNTLFESTNLTSARSNATKDRFITLWDEIGVTSFAFNGASLDAMWNATVSFQKYFKLNGLKSTYANANADVPVSGALLFGFYADNNVSVMNNTGYVRVNFVDA